MVESSVHFKTSSAPIINNINRWHNLKVKQCFLTKHSSFEESFFAAVTSSAIEEKLEFNKIAGLIDIILTPTYYTLPAVVRICNTADFTAWSNSYYGRAVISYAKSLMNV